MLQSHEPICTERVPGTMERMPGTCNCGAPEVLAEVIQFRSRSQREAELTRGLAVDEDRRHGDYDA
jgi:hypothetical protein